MAKLSISCFENKFKKTDKHPDFTIHMKGEDGGFIKVGALWLKEDKNGGTYFAGTLNTDGDDYEQQDRAPKKKSFRRDERHDDRRAAPKKQGSWMDKFKRPDKEEPQDDQTDTEIDEEDEDEQEERPARKARRTTPF